MEAFMHKHVGKLEAENKKLREALYAIAGTNTKTGNVNKDWKEMMLVSKQIAKTALEESRKAIAKAKDQ